MSFDPHLFLPCELWQYKLSLCVCLSATSRSCTKMAKPRITQITPYDSAGTLSFLLPKISAKFQRHHPQLGYQIEEW